ncbi:shikimate kinase [soil metagenome]
MGSGKSYWGQRWSAVAELPFYDLDEMIEKAYKKKIIEIFEKKGEEKFREMERMHLRKFARRKKFILACGGGTPCFFDNLQWMKMEGKVIYIKASPKTIAGNLAGEMAQRPLLKEVNPEKIITFIRRKLNTRKSFYHQADAILDQAKITDQTILKIITSNS